MGHFHPLADYYLTQVAKGLFLDGIDKVGLCRMCASSACSYERTYVHCACSFARLTLCVCTRVQPTPTQHSSSAFPSSRNKQVGLTPPTPTPPLTHPHHTHIPQQVGLTHQQTVAVRRMRAARSMREFHLDLHHFTGHGDAAQYFEAQNPGPLLKDIARPTLFINRYVS